MSLTFAQALRSLLKKTDFSIRAFAEELKVDRSKVDRWRKGQMPSSTDMLKIVEAFKAKGVRETDLKDFQRLHFLNLEISQANPPQNHEGDISEARLSRIQRTYRELSRSTNVAGMLLNDIETITKNWQRLTIAREEMERGDTAISKDSLHETIQDEDSTRALKISSIISLAKISRSEGNLEQALTQLDEALHLASQNEGGNLDLLRPQVNILIGDFNRRKGDFSKTADSYEIAKRHVTKVRLRRPEEANLWKLELSRIERKKAGLALFKGEFLKAIRHCNDSASHLKGMLFDNEQTKIEQHRGWALAMLGRWDEALKIHSNVVEKIDFSSNRISERVKARRYKADVLRMSGQLTEAERLYQDAVDLLDENSNESLEEGEIILRIPLLLGIAQLKRKRGGTHPPELEEAYRRNLGKGVTSPANYKDIYYLALTLSEQGNHLAPSKPNEAMALFSQAQTIFRQLENKYYVKAMEFNLCLLTRENIHVQADPNLLVVNYRASILNSLIAARKSERSSRAREITNCLATIERIAINQLDNAYLCEESFIFLRDTVGSYLSINEKNQIKAWISKIRSPNQRMRAVLKRFAASLERKGTKGELSSS